MDINTTRDKLGNGSTGISASTISAGTDSNYYTMKINSPVDDYMIQNANTSLSFLEATKKIKDAIQKKCDVNPYPRLRANKWLPGIKKVIFNPPATIVMWDDGTKTVVKAKGGKKNERDEFSEEYGLAMAIAKRYSGSRSAFLKTVNDAKRPEAK